MDHNRKIIGFIGIDKYEYILYLSRLLYQLNKKTLLLDCSLSKALTACVPAPAGLSNKRIEYRGVMFQDIKSSSDGITAAKDMGGDEFDCILIDYDDEVKILEDNQLDILVYVTDQQMHNIRHLAELKVKKTAVKILVIKNYIQHRTSPSFIIQQLKLSTEDLKNTYVISQDEVDDKSKLSCQSDYVFKFNKVSHQTKNFIKGIAAELYPDITKRALNKGLKRAGRGL